MSRVIVVDSGPEVTTNGGVLAPETGRGQVLARRNGICRVTMRKLGGFRITTARREKTTPPNMKRK